MDSKYNLGKKQALLLKTQSYIHKEYSHDCDEPFKPHFFKKTFRLQAQLYKAIDWNLKVHKSHFL